MKTNLLSLLLAIAPLFTTARADGGYEVNQYLLGGFDARLPDDRLADSSIYGSDFVIAFNPLPGYGIEARFPYAGFFGARRGDVLLLSKELKGSR